MYPFYIPSYFDLEHANSKDMLDEECNKYVSLNGEVRGFRYTYSDESRISW